MLFDIHPPSISQAILVVAVVSFLAKVSGAVGKWCLGYWPVTKVLVVVKGSELYMQHNKAIGCSSGKTKNKRNSAEHEESQLYKDFYFKLHNLEQFPEILPKCRDLLVSLFTETLAEGLSRADVGILSLNTYTSEGLANFIRTDNDNTAQQWEQYVIRRRSGSPAEMFQDVEEAKWWLKQMAPVKYVDGAWLSHINKITTPFTLRRTTKTAWQVMSEELGDGDPEKHHVYIYRELMKNIESGLPEAHDIDFIHNRHELNEIKAWKAAVGQLLISLFPHEFLPEILGFNLHFEGLTTETLKVAKEIQDLGLNPYYFVLHVSIDNAHSGHTAMAMKAVVAYIEHVLKTHGESSAQQAWKRVQAGFILSQGLSVGLQIRDQPDTVNSFFPRNSHEAEVIKIFEEKAPVAHKIHCRSRLKIGTRTLVDWLEPHAFAEKQWQIEFLDYLSNSKLWVYKGDSRKSKLIHELSWEGRMFGAFMQSEVEALKRWIDALAATPNVQDYWAFTGRPVTSSKILLEKQDIRVHYPVFLSSPPENLLTKRLALPGSSFRQSSVYTKPDLAKLLPLWFTNPCLLESFGSIPSKTSSIVGASVVRILRAQYEFDTEGPVVAGMDEVHRVDSLGLVELGLEMLGRCGLYAGSLLDVLEAWPSEFAVTMLKLSMRPMENSGLLLGLAYAFIGLHDRMVSSILLSDSGKMKLKHIVRREQECLELCFNELKDDKIGYADFHRGYGLGLAEIESCFAER